MVNECPCGEELKKTTLEIHHDPIRGVDERKVLLKCPRKKWFNRHVKTVQYV